MHSTLPKTLNGPQRNVAGKTTDSVRLVESSLSRLCDTIKDYHYSRTILFKCVTLDMKHFHATTHYKNDEMSMLQYCRSFGNYVKESVKNLSVWSAHYFTLTLHIRVVGTPYQRVQFSFVKSQSSNLFQQEKLALSTPSDCKTPQASIEEQ